MTDETASNEAPRPEPIAWQGALPLFYKNPQFVSLERHRDAGLNDVGDFSFARDTNSVPLGADEMLSVQAFFPIVFTESDPAMPVAVLGMGGSRNSFVGDDGKWRAGVPIPAYIRRYPFIFAGDSARRSLHVAIDEASPHFAASGGRPLFENDQPTNVMREALAFCAAFQTQIEHASAFAAAMNAAGLLVSKRVAIQLPDGRALSLDRFRIIDEERFHQLPEETILGWFKSKWLGLVYAHLLSMRRWDALGEQTPAPPASAVA